MKVRELAARVAASVVIVGGVSLVVSPSVMAIPLAATYEADCAFSSESANVTGQVGDTVTVQLVGYDCYPLTSNPGVVSWMADYPTTPATNPTQVCHNSSCNGANPETIITLTLEQAGTTTWTALQNDLGLTLNITVTGRANPIPPWVQGYGRGSAADTCKDGWTASWELWPHGGTGGWVCTREIPSLG